MKSISIFGLGYVGTVTAACFASRGHRVIGVDRQRATQIVVGVRRIAISEVDCAGRYRSALRRRGQDGVEGQSGAESAWRGRRNLHDRIRRGLGKRRCG